VGGKKLECVFFIIIIGFSYLPVGLAKCQVPVVLKVDNTIQWISVDKTNHIIHWIVIYPVDSVIHLLNNWGQ